MTAAAVADVDGVMRIGRLLLVLAAGATFGACATAPARRGAGAEIVLAQDLRLCSGMGISNAPAADDLRRVNGFAPTARLRGVTILRAPVLACVSSGFGPRKGGAGAFHHGVDLYTGAPETVFAGGDGVVVENATLRGYGRTIVIDHGRGVRTRYAHLSEIAPGLRRGARVTLGAPIGMTGRTGNATAVHLHYEVTVDGRAANPLAIGD